MILKNSFNENTTHARRIFKTRDVYCEDANIVPIIATMAKITLDEIIKDIDALTCALYYVDEEEIYRLEEAYSAESYQRKAADIAMYMKHHWYLKKAAIKGHFFANNAKKTA